MTWHNIRSKLFANTTLDTSCVAQWKYTVLENVYSYYLEQYFYALEKLDDIKENTVILKYVKSEPDQPRILQLGDSVSMSVWRNLQDINGLNLTVHGAPNNCGGFDLFKTNLSSWLGICPWDLVQFNVGLHYWSRNMTNMTSYISELTAVVSKIRSHSPSAHIVFALTTPSPFDSNLTVPDITSCKNYGSFFKAGVVSKLNDAARMGLSKMNVTINDRYSLVLPFLGKYQRPCDVHYHEEGYRFMAYHDLDIFSDILQF